MVLDVAFAPAHFGLRVATACRDGYVRVYEAKDTFNLERWESPEVFEAGMNPTLVTSAKPNKSTVREPNNSGDYIAKEALRNAVTCLCWNPSPRNGFQTLVAGVQIVRKQ